MKRLFLLSVIIIVSVSAVFAQDNKRVPFYMGTIEYKSPDALSTASGLFSNHIQTEDKTIVPQIEEGVKSAPSKVYRLIVKEGAAPNSTSEEAYRMDVLISRVMSGTDKSGVSATAKCTFSLVDLRSGKVVNQEKVERLVNKQFYMVHNISDCAKYLGLEMDYATRAFLLNYFPTTGKILQKGVEKDNGKINDKQCYIDLGENVHVYKKLTFVAYTNDGKEIGKLRIEDVQGDDISVCKITKGASKIEETLKSGATVYVKTAL